MTFPAVKKIYLTRHAQTDFNKNGIVQGSGVDSDLNDTGRRQAAAFFEQYKNIPFQKIYTSTLKRSVQSVSGFMDKGIPAEHLEGLNEIDWGKREASPITVEENEYYLYVISQWREGNTSLRIEGGESPEDLQTKQKRALDYILSHEDEREILICMHGRAMRIFLCLLLGYELKYMDIFEHSNMCLYQLDYTGSMFALKRPNDVSHLQNV